VGPGDEAALVEDFRAARRDPALAVLEGFHAVKHALRFGAEIVRVVVADRERVVGMAAALAPDVSDPLRTLAQEVPADAFARLSAHPPHTGAIGIARRPAHPALPAGRDAPCVLLEDPRDLSNLGACVRVAAAAGAAAVVVTGQRDPWAAEALRGSAGLHFALPVLHGAPAGLGGRPLVALDPAGRPFDPRALPAGAVLAFGTERDGLSDALRERAGAVVALPMRPGVSSLNLATSVSATLYAWRLAAGA
jgi:RNA methyltransferase, TrmH family